MVVSKKRKVDGGSSHGVINKSLFNARLFWIATGNRESLSTTYVATSSSEWDASKTAFWKNNKSLRLSLQDIWSIVDLREEFAWRKEVQSLVDKNLLRFYLRISSLLFPLFFA